MAVQPSVAGRSPLSAQVVGNAFVQQYYHILHQSPELVYRFYQESSKLGRPDAHGAMSLITTTEAINEKILSIGFVRVETKSVDAQESLGGGVIVLVTGFLTGEDTVKRDFTQSFFLAPQDKGYYVLNDIFRFVEEADNQPEHQGLVNGTSAPHVPEHGSPTQKEQHALEQTSPSAVEDEGVSEVEVYNPSDNGEVVEEEEPMGEVINEAPNTCQTAVVESRAVTTQEELPKKSYASIVKILKGSSSAFVPARIPSRPTSIKAESQALPTPAADVPASSFNAAESSIMQEAEADGYSIYVKNLPLDATPAQLEEEFKKFGAIKSGGIQVRSHKLQGFCFGFVELEAVSAVQSAIEASPVIIGGRQAYVEEKRTTGSRVSNRGRFAPDRGGGFYNDGRGRGYYGGGRGYGRGDYNARPDFGSRGGGRGRSSNRRSDVGYQRV
ncbi:nuclear transport factor 2-like [Musa acuminata AAA Group]|uniref:nuclear transport factor 2 n=1 Tax=Musa acuminata AAA Group TaxID=214697 RepID=UPI0031D4C5D2